MLNKMLKMLQVVVLVGVFTFCWGPYALLAMAGILGLSAHIPVLVTVLPLQVQYRTVQYSTVQYSTVYYSTVRTVQYSTV